jgi:hypothetical protein
LGADHNYLNETSQVQGDMHFYSYDQSPADNQGKYSHKEEVFLGYYHRWVQYRLMRKYLEKKGISIYNATDGSFLDVFPFVRLVDIISDKNTKKRNHDF